MRAHRWLFIEHEAPNEKTTDDSNACPGRTEHGASQDRANAPRGDPGRTAGKSRWRSVDRVLGQADTASASIMTMLSVTCLAADGREIAFYYYATKGLKPEDVDKLQRRYRTTWRGTGTDGGLFSWESTNGLWMVAERLKDMTF